MGLQGAGLVLRYIYNYRICWIGGRFGGGKTSLAYRLAYDLKKKFPFRYVLSNVKDVWSDKPEDVVLRDGVFVDAIIILDEGGGFITTAKEADMWVEFLRKINVVLLLPSVRPPHRDMRTLTVRRDVNWQSLGVPCWAYTAKLDSGDIEEKFNFRWWHPNEIIGVYDTLGFPTDAKELLGNVKDWIKQAAANTGYEATAKRGSSIDFGDAFDSGTLGEIGREVDALSEAAHKADRTISLLERKASGGRRRKS